MEENPQKSFTLIKMPFISLRNVYFSFLLFKHTKINFFFTVPPFVWFYFPHHAHHDLAMMNVCTEIVCN